MCSSVPKVRSISFQNAAYSDIVFEINDNVPVNDCAKLLLDLEVSLYAGRCWCSLHSLWLLASHFLAIIEILKHYYIHDNMQKISEYRADEK